MHKAEFVLKNKTLKFLWNTNGSPNLVQTTRPSDGKKKKDLRNSGLCCPGSPLSKIDRKQKER